MKVLGQKFVSFKESEMKKVTWVHDGDFMQGDKTI